MQVIGGGLGIHQVLAFQETFFCVSMMAEKETKKGAARYASPYRIRIVDVFVHGVISQQYLPNELGHGHPCLQVADVELTDIVNQHYEPKTKVTEFL